MNILDALVRLRDDLKTWVVNNLNALYETIESQDLFSGDYNDLTNAPNISEDNSDNVVITDNDGHIIFKVDSEGTHTTDVKINGMSIGAKISELDAKSGFSGDYNDLINAPNIFEDGSNDLVIADESGNVIFRVDETGAHTTVLDAQDVTINSQSVTEIMDAKVAALVNGAPETLDTLGELAAAMNDNSDILEAIDSITSSKAEKEDLVKLQGLVSDHANDTDLHFSGDYNDLTNAPNIIENNEGDMIVADEAGRIIFKVDADGIHSTGLTLNGQDILTMVGGSGGGGIVDSAMSATSTNPVQNKVIYEQIKNLQESKAQVQIITWESDD